MFRNLMYKFPIFMTLAVGLATSCSNKVEDINNSEAAASFVNTPVQLESSVEHKSLWPDSAWNDIPNYALFKFKTCLKDKAIFNAVIDEPFQIKTPISSKTLRTNINGCLIWTEKVDFNYLEQERLINFPIAINGIGHYKGTRSFELALNPWPEASSSMIYLKNDEAVANAFQIYGHNEKAEELRASQKNLMITDLKFSARPARMYKNAKEFPLDVQFKALIALRGLNGENKTNKEISKGRFKVEFSLFETPEASTDNYLVSTAEKEVTALNGQIQEQITFSIPNEVKLDDRSFYHLQMVISPINAPADLATKEILNITDFNIESGSVGIVNRVNEPQIISKRPIESLPEPNNSTVIGEEVSGDDKVGYYLKKITNIRRGSIVSDNYRSSSIKTRRAKFTLCLNEESSSDSQVPLSDTHVAVNIILENGKSDNPDTERIYKTNEDGCIESYANITYDRYGIERWIPFIVHVSPLSGTYEGIAKKRELKVNPWNPEDFGYDTKFETEIPTIKTQAPRLFVGSIEYKKDLMDYSEFRINEFLHMSLKRKYQLSFNPKIELFHSYKDESVTEAINFGDYEVTLSLFKPLNTDVDYYNPDLSQFKFITSAKKDVKIQANGTVTDMISLPFLVSETQELAFKNLALMEIKIKNSSNSIRPVIIAFPFFGGNKGASMPAVTFEKELTKEMRALISQTVKNGKYLPTIDVLGDPSADPMANFAFNFKEDGLKLEKNAIVKDMRLDEFNKSSKVAAWERVNLPKGKTLREKVEVTKRELRTLVTEHAAKYPRDLLNKFCRHFYDLPNIKRETRLFQRINAYDGGEKYLNCMEDPNAHFKVTPVTHIRKILSRKSDKPGEAFATYVESTRGKVARGNAFFAAYGDRSSNVNGDVRSQRETTNYSYGIEGPGPYYIGFSKQHSVEYGVFEQNNQADMEAAFDRFYTQRELSDLQYDQLKLKFYAQVRRCATIIGTQTNSARVHLCEDEDRPKALEEEWYFIGDTRSQDHGMIADGSFPGVTGFTQVIRGRYNYNRLWNKYKNEDIKLVLSEIGDSRGLTYAFKRYLKETEGGLPYENFVDNSHPGLYVSPRY